MALDISQRITNSWPSTEAKLSADTDLDYATAKADAIADAKREVYGTSTPPSEADLEEIVAAWIADKATIMLIPMAKEWLAYNQHRSQSNKRGDDVQNYDIMSVLDGLRDELRRDCDANWPEVQDLAGKNLEAPDIPAVSHDGPIVNATLRAMARGPF